MEALLRSKCRALYKEGNYVYVACSFINLMPWRNSIEIAGEVVNGPLSRVNGNIWRIHGIRGSILLKGKEGSIGKIGSKNFIFHVPDVNVLGLKNGIVIVHIIGHGKYRGYIYGSYVEGEIGSSNDIVIGIPPIRGNKAKLEVGGLILEKQLPSFTSLNELDIMLPYVVLNIENDCKEIYSWENVEVMYSDFSIEKVYGHQRICGKSFIYYRGFIEEPINVLLRPSKDVLRKRVVSVDPKRDYVVLRTSSETVVISKDDLKVFPGRVIYCRENDTEVLMDEKGIVNVLKGGKPFASVRFNEKVSSCEVLNDKIYLTVPSRKPESFASLVNIGNGFTFIPFIAEVSDVPWIEEWGYKDTSFVTRLGSNEITFLEEGISKLVKLEEGLLLAYNLYGGVFLIDENLKLLWKRETRGVRSVAASKDMLAIWSQRPPRLRLFSFMKDKRLKEVRRLRLGLNHVSLCFDGKLSLFVAIDDNGNVLYINEHGEIVLKGKAEPSWACISFDPYLVTINENGVKLWKRLTSMEDWDEIYLLIPSEF
ncbi:hypothetical protein EYM_07435 [Ignicoccus islandicus DSM 13165]|uniref:Uncharacterized protein n=1 Tax=Ignicoccus islandicus DSM 13165 TaxID=940295 RepID=A0A0U3E4D4_9CREN|nr:hypothetical protein [Ignicoccus islandicus]ALU12779.1 hypothetical protein EYM_07435 [Ignicoccus islandicus DSM 13165]